MPNRSHSSRWIGRGVRLLIGLAVLVAVARTLGRSDLARGVATARDAGWPVLLVLAGLPLALGLDALGWQAILRALGTPVRWRELVRIRFASEVVVMALPGGTVMGEAVKLARLRRSVGTTAGLTSQVLARTFHAGAGGLYLGMATAAATTMTPGLAPSHRSLILTLGAGGASLLIALWAVSWALFRRGRLAPWSGHLPLRGLRAWAARRQAALQQLDLHCQRYFSAPPGARWRAGVCFLLQWLVEGAETIFILALLNPDIGWRGGLLIDSTTSLLRAAAVIVPAGLGIQEANQYFLLNALGVRDAAVTAAALMFIKRSKELFWIVTGAIVSTATTESSWQTTLPRSS